MQTLRVQTRSGADRILHLDIPVEAPNATYDVVVVLQPRSDSSAPPTAEERSWPAGFFEATAGAWKGDFVRDQGQFEEREEF
jgi:hypothetical protein